MALEAEFYCSLCIRNPVLSVGECSQWLLCKHKGPTPRQSLIPSLFVFVMGVLSRLIAKAVDGFYFLFLIIIIRLLYKHGKITLEQRSLIFYSR